MTFILNASSVSDYLVEHKFCNHSEQPLNKVEPVAAKNFNLLLTFPDGRKLLVKQERHDREGKAAGEFLSEWRIQELLQRFSKLNHISSFLPEVLKFDKENSILVFKYLDDYRDLMDFYTKENTFPSEIAAAIGTRLATIHRDTFNCQEYQDFFCQNQDNSISGSMAKLIRGLERISPEIFGSVPADGLKFFALYQRYDSLGQAIAQLASAFSPCCLTHNDLKLNNILLHTDWQQSSDNIVRLTGNDRLGETQLLIWEHSSAAMCKSGWEVW